MCSGVEHVCWLQPKNSPFETIRLCSKNTSQVKDEQANACPQQCISTANNGFIIFNHVDTEVRGLIDEGVNGAIIAVVESPSVLVWHHLRLGFLLAMCSWV